MSSPVSSATQPAAAERATPPLHDRAWHRHQLRSIAAGDEQLQRVSAGVHSHEQLPRPMPRPPVGHDRATVAIAYVANLRALVNARHDRTSGDCPWTAGEQLQLRRGVWHSGHLGMPAPTIARSTGLALPVIEHLLVDGRLRRSESPE